MPVFVVSETTLGLPSCFGVQIGVVTLVSYCPLAQIKLLCVGDSQRTQYLCVYLFLTFLGGLTLDFSFSSNGPLTFLKFCPLPSHLPVSIKSVFLQVK